MEKCNANETTSVSVTRGSGSFTESAHATGVYTATCIDCSGNVKWTEDFRNVVTTQGKNYLLDQLFSASSTNVFRMGLKGAGTESGTGTYASHAAWVEITAYTGTRGTPTFSAASASSKSTSVAVSFTINGNATVAGCFLVMAPTLTTLGTVNDTSATGAVLYSAGDFTVSKVVSSGDTLNVSYTASL
jgi:hypothetical protein